MKKTTIWPVIYAAFVEPAPVVHQPAVVLTPVAPAKAMPTSPQA